MRRIITLLLALVLVFSILTLVSCKKDENGNDNGIETLAGKTPKQLYEISKEKLDDAKEYSITTTQLITMSAITMNQTIVNKVNGNNAYVETTNDSAPELNTKAWYVDGIMYQNLYTGKFKREYDKEKFMEEYMDNDPSEDTFLDIPDSWFKNVRFKKDGDIWTLNFVIDAAKYNELLDNLLLDGNITGDVIYKLYFDGEGNIDKLTTSFDMTIDGVSTHCYQISKITLGSVTVTAPSDTESYITINPQTDNSITLPPVQVEPDPIE